MKQRTLFKITKLLQKTSKSQYSQYNFRLKSSKAFSKTNSSKCFSTTISTQLPSNANNEPYNIKTNYTQFSTTQKDNLSILNKYAILIEDSSNYSMKIIFPDKKFSIEINLKDDQQTLGDLHNSHRERSDIDGVLSFSFVDTEGNAIANTTKAEVLSKLPCFNICIDTGEKNYKCFNSKYLGNSDLTRKVDFEFTDNQGKELENYIFNKDFTVQESLNRSCVVKGSLSYNDILNNILQTKYGLLEEAEKSISLNKEIRYSKALNAFFYLTTIQVISLNLCTFVFLNWDIMEPITQCLTFANIIIGYYYWAFTKSDYDPEGFLKIFSSSNSVKNRKYLKNMYQERELIKKLLVKNDKI